jgi:hypothetical protein
MYVLGIVYVFGRDLINEKIKIFQGEGGGGSFWVRADIFVDL